MRDYAELNEDLRYCASEETACIKCKHWGKSTCANELCGKAADAIKELLAAVPKWVSVGADQKCPVSATACIIGYFNGGKYDQLWWFDFISTDKNGFIAPHNTDIEGRCIAVYALPEPSEEVE